jgi:hypothetical protein
MPTTEFTFAQIKKGFFGVFIPNVIPNPTVLSMANQSNIGDAQWAGWITGTECIMHQAPGGGYWKVQVDGEPVQVRTDGWTVTDFTVFTGRSDEPHFVQIFNNGFTATAGWRGPGADETLVNVFQVTGSDPAIEGFGEFADVHFTGDINFPGVDSAPRNPAWSQPYENNAQYQPSDIVEGAGGSAYQVPNFNGAPFFSGPAGRASAPAGGVGTVGIGEDDGSVTWTRVATLPLRPYFLSSDYNFGAQPAWGNIKRRIYGRPGSWGGFQLTTIKGKGEELWVRKSDVNSARNSVICGTQVIRSTVGVAVNTNISKIGGTATYTAANLPPGVTFDGTTFAGTPTTSGDYVTVVNAANGTGATKSWYVFRVAGAAGCPVFLQKFGVKIRRNVPTVLSIVVGNGATSYTATGLPSGLGINAVTGVISGTATGSGPSSATITATNATGTSTCTLHFSVEATGIPSFTDVTGMETGNAYTGVLWYSAAPGYFHQVNCTGSPTAFSATGLPAGLSINATTGKITGTPTAFGTFDVTIIVSNAIGANGTTLRLNVATNNNVGAAAQSSTQSDIWYSIDGGPFMNGDYAWVDPVQLYPGGVAPSGVAINATQDNIWVCIARELDSTSYHTYDIIACGDGVAMRSPFGMGDIVTMPKTRTKVAFMGDSTMQAIDNTQPEGHHIGARLGMKAINCALAGSTSLDLIRRTRRTWLMSEKPDHIVTMATINDGGVPGGSAWAPSTGYSTGFSYQNSLGEVYVCVSSGISGLVEPTGYNLTSGGIVDGGVTWRSAAPVAPWIAGSYTIGRIVQNGGQTYYCDGAGTSVTGPTGINATPNSITDGGTATWRSCTTNVAWAAGSFNLYDMVQNNGYTYMCTVAGTSVTGPLGRCTSGDMIGDGGTARWVCVSGFVPVMVHNAGLTITNYAWAGGARFEQHDVVFNGNYAYRCTTGGISAASGGPTGTNQTPDSITDGTAKWCRLPYNRTEIIKVFNTISADVSGSVIARPIATPAPTTHAANASGLNATYRAANAALADPRCLFIDDTLESATSSPAWDGYRENNGSHLTARGARDLALLALRDYYPRLVGTPATGFVW